MLTHSLARSLRSFLSSWDSESLDGYLFCIFLSILNHCALGSARYLRRGQWGERRGWEKKFSRRCLFLFCFLFVASSPDLWFCLKLFRGKKSAKFVFPMRPSVRPSIYASVRLSFRPSACAVVPPSARPCMTRIKELRSCQMVN